MKIDFSYKDNPLKITYDIESTPNLFTLAMIHDKSMSLIIFGDHQFDDLDEKDLVKQMRRFASKKYNKKLLGIKHANDLEYHVKHYRQGNAVDMTRFLRDMIAMQTCMALDIDKSRGYRFVEYH